MFKEFKEFIQRGNVMDTAVGLVMGAAFKAIVDSVVADIIMPLIGLLTGGLDFTDWKIVLREATATTEELSITYGNLITTILNFLLVALAIFFMVKGINKMRRQQEEAPEEPPAPSKEEELLVEIRDLIAKK